MTLVMELLCGELVVKEKVRDVESFGSRSEGLDFHLYWFLDEEVWL